MHDGSNPMPLARGLTRRQMVAGLAIALGGMCADNRLLGQAPPTKSRTSLHDEVEIKAAPNRIYAVLLDSKQFSSFTGLPAEIDPNAGGVFSMFGGKVVGRNIELVAGQRIVQAWRPAYWDPGVYSLVKFEIKSQGAGSMVVLDHTGFPEGDADSLESGWRTHYWEPLKKYLS